MRRSAWLGLAALCGFAMALAGCGLFPAWTGIEGYVTSGRGDGALAGATVTLYSTSGLLATEVASGVQVAETATGTDGYFAFKNLAPGSYMLTSEKADYASCRYQQLTVLREQHVRADLIQFPRFDPNRPTTAPSFTGLTNLTKNATVSDTLDGDVTAAPADASLLPLRRLVIKYGHLSNGSDVDANDPAGTDGNAVTTFSWETTTSPDGASFVYFIAYDVNEDACIMQIPIVINNHPEGLRPTMPRDFTVTSMTFAQPNGYRAPVQGSAVPPKLPSQIYYQGKYVRLPQPTPNEPGRAIAADSSLFVEIAVLPQAGVQSYAIYRSRRRDQGYALIGVRRHDPVNHPEWYFEDGDERQWLWYHDFDPALMVGTTYYYRVAAIKAGGESRPSRSLAVKMLAPITITLTGPANNAITTLHPTFSWTVTGLETDKATLMADLYVLPNDLDPGASDLLPLAWEATFFNYRSVVYGQTEQTNNPRQYLRTLIPPTPLQRMTRYEWDLFFAAGLAIWDYDPFNEDDCVAYAMTMSGHDGDPGSGNGVFTFTTQ